MSELDDIIKKMMLFNDGSKKDQEEAIQGVFILIAYAKAFEQTLQETENGSSISHDTLIAIKNSSLNSQNFIYELASKNEKQSKEDKEIDEIINRVGRKRHFNN